MPLDCLRSDGYECESQTNWNIRVFSKSSAETRETNTFFLFQWELIHFLIAYILGIFKKIYEYLRKFD